MPNFHELIDVFEKAREFIRLENNDFNWSGWENAIEAEAEIDAIVYALRLDTLLVLARILFLPTGPLQEVSVSSGWGDAFVWLANWYDEGESGTSCFCYNEPIRDLGTLIGTDARLGDVHVAQCPSCGRLWLRYHYELEAKSKSGRWYLGPLRQDVVHKVTAVGAPAFYEDMLWYFAGGSYYDGFVRKVSGALVI